MIPLARLGLVIAVGILWAVISDVLHIERALTALSAAIFGALAVAYTDGWR